MNHGEGVVRQSEPVKQVENREKTPKRGGPGGTPCRRATTVEGRRNGRAAAPRVEQRDV